MNIIHKAHIEHFVRFIKNDCLYVVQLDCLAVNVVKETTRGADNNLWFLLQSSDLANDILTAVNRERTDSFEAGQLADLFSYLNGKLTSWRHNQSNDTLFFSRDFVD
ncbi:hypothetical protein D3C85_1673190 [compost metagenome]